MIAGLKIVIFRRELRVSGDFGPAKKVSKNTCFDDSIVFQACFERLRKLIKLLNLARASRFSLILTHHKTMKTRCFCRQHRVSGPF